MGPTVQNYVSVGFAVIAVNSIKSRTVICRDDTKNMRKMRVCFKYIYHPPTAGLPHFFHMTLTLHTLAPTCRRHILACWP